MARPVSEPAFLGVGWAMPVQFGSDRQIALVATDEDVRQALYIILGTDRGERLMRPGFGAGLGEFLFEPVTASTFEAIRQRVTEALIDWEPRIDLLEVLVEPGNADRSRLDIHIRYRVRTSNTEHNLVYPFYLREGDGA